MFAQGLASGRFHVQRIDHESWQTSFSEEQQTAAARALEASGLILLPRLAFAVGDGEARLLAPGCVRPGSKHVSFDSGTGQMRGAALPQEAAAALRQMIAALHAALSGQFLLEQTFLLPVDGMLEPDRSPLRILERLTGRRLA